MKTLTITKVLESSTEKLGNVIFKVEDAAVILSISMFILCTELRQGPMQGKNGIMQVRHWAAYSSVARMACYGQEEPWINPR